MDQRSTYSGERLAEGALAAAIVASVLLLQLSWIVFANMLHLGITAAAVSQTLVAISIISGLWLALHRLPGDEPTAYRLTSCRPAAPAEHIPLQEVRPTPEGRSNVVPLRRAPLGVPTREHLLKTIDEDIADGCDSALLATVELEDYDRLYAFDPSAATDALGSFSKTLAAVVGDRHPIAHVDRGIFGIWFSDCRAESARAELRAVCYALRAQIVTPELTIVPELHARIGNYPLDGEDADSLLTHALVSGRDPFSDESEPAAVIQSMNVARERYSLEQDLRRAVERKELELHFQPIINLPDARVHGAEALIRWNHPTAGLISPSRFVPILEDTGLIDEIGMWTLNAACRACRSWHDKGLKDLSVAVNLSARQLENPRLTEAVERTLTRHGLPAGALALELTETAAMQDARRTLDLFSEFKAIGVRLSIDDFGTGYSSLSYLLKLPFDKLKIDREFVVDVDRRPDRQAVCRSLCELARGLDIRLIVEGAETAAEVATLQNIGCRFFQGFYFSHPVNGDSFMSLVLDQSWVRARCTFDAKLTDHQFAGHVS